MTRKIYIVSLAFSVVAAIALTHWALVNAPFIYATGVAAICGANILTHIALIKGETE